MQRLTRTRLLAAASAAAASAALLVPAASPAAATATARPGQATTSRADWTCGSDVVDDYRHDGEQIFFVSCSKDSDPSDHVGVEFYSYGEVIRIFDGFDNDRPTYAEVYVERSGTASWYGDGKWRVINESFSEGKDVGLRVCTSDSAAAVCSKQYIEPNFT